MQKPKLIPNLPVAPSLARRPAGAGRRSRLRAISAVGSAAILALAAAGCGIGINGNKTSKRVSSRVTTGFGSDAIGTTTRSSFASGSSILALTKQFYPLTTSAGGGSVEAINGHSADAAKRVGWSYYVNGIGASMGASLTSVHPGDHIWWDLHDASAAKNVPAVVGSFPEPFLNGSGGQAYPTVVTCGSHLTRACTTVTKSLSDAGVKVSFQGLGTGSGSDSLAVLVGTFTQLEGVIASELLQGGPSKSGVYAKFVVGQHSQVLELENPKGDVADTIYNSVGLIAAIEQPGLNEPVWLVTGTDTAGVDAAAKALTAGKLADHFAVAVLPSGRIMPLPLQPTT